MFYQLVENYCERKHLLHPHLQAYPSIALLEISSAAKEDKAKFQLK